MRYSCKKDKNKRMVCKNSTQMANGICEYYGKVLSPSILSKNFSLKDELSKYQFNNRTITLNFPYDKNSRKNIQKMLKKKLYDEELATLFSGGLAQADITFEYYGNNMAGVVKHPFFKIPFTVQIREDEKGKLEMSLANLFEKDMPKTIGTRLLANIVAQALSFKVSRIRCSAAKKLYDPLTLQPYDGNGYYSWARMGFDTSINEVKKVLNNKLPDEFSECERLSDIMSTPQGRQWWKENGSDIDLEFDLSKGSRSIDILTNYLKEKEIRL